MVGNLFSNDSDISMVQLSGILFGFSQYLWNQCVKGNSEVTVWCAITSTLWSNWIVNGHLGVKNKNKLFNFRWNGKWLDSSLWRNILTSGFVQIKLIQNVIDWHLTFLILVQCKPRNDALLGVWYRGKQRFFVLYILLKAFKLAKSFAHAIITVFKYIAYNLFL